MVNVEQRGAPRVKFTGITLVYSGESELSCIAKNVSESGILVLPREPHSIKEGESLYLTFILPNAPKWLKLRGEVVRRTKASGLSGFAVEFRALADHARDELLKYAKTGGAAAIPPRRDPTLPPPIPPSDGDLEIASAVQSDDDGEDSTIPWGRESAEERGGTSVAPSAEQEQLLNSCGENSRQSDTKVIAEDDLFALRMETIRPNSRN